MVRPPVHSVHQELPYHELKWEFFEHLCRRLVAKKEPQAIEVRLYLSEGYEQHGIDGYAYDPTDGKYITFQCKRHQKFTASKIKKAVDDFLAGDFVSKSKKFILCVTAHIDERYESEIARQRERLRANNIQLITWDQAGLDSALKNEPQLVYEFFDGCKETVWVRAFCGEDKVKEISEPIQLRNYPAPTAFIERLLQSEQSLGNNKTNDRPPKTLTELLLKESLTGPCRVFLRSEAGVGKSTELANAAYYFAASQGTILFPILLPLKNYVDEDLLTWLDRLQKGWRSVQAGTLLLLVDGLDEVKAGEREKFIRRLRALLDDYSTCHVVLSCRTNFSSDKLQFDEFTTYDLREFERTDINEYIEKVLQPFEVDAFSQLLDDEDLLQWLKNPFSLIQFVGFFRTNPATVPRTRVDLLSRVVEQRIKLDLVHHRDSNAAPIYYRLLKRMAFVMNRLGVNSLSEADWCRVVPNDIERERCRELSLLRIIDERVSFEHNILQEYFSALVLADQPFERAKRNVSFRPTFERIKPKWFNTIGLWLEILPGDSVQLAQLLQLVSQREPQLLLTIEYQHFSNDLRFEAFQSVIQQSDRVTRHRLNYDERLTAFANIRHNSQVIAYLLEQIAQDDGEVSSECLFYLSKADPTELFGYDSEICHLLEQELIKDNRLRQELAVEVAVNLNISNARITQLVTSEMPNLNSVRIRDDIYRYLRQTGQAESYIDFLLEGIEVYRSYRSRESTSYLGVGWALLNLLSHLQQATSLHRLLDYLIINVKHIDGKDSLFRYDTVSNEGFFLRLSKRLATAYTTDISLYNKVATFYRQLTKHSDEAFADDLSLFFELTGTQELIFGELIKSESLWHYDRLIGKVVTEPLLEECLQRYKHEIFTINQIRCIIHGLYIDKRSELAEKLQMAVEQIGRDDFTPNVNYTAIHEKRKQRDYELLADQFLFIEKVKDVFEDFHSDEVEIDKLYEYRRSWADLDNEVILHFLTRFEFKEKFIKRAEIVNWLQKTANWGPYVRGELLARLEDKSALSVPEIHLDGINQWCQSNISRANFWESISQKRLENGLTTSQRCLEWRLSEFYRLTDIEFTKPALLDMLGTELYGSQWARKDEKPTLSNKIIEELDDREAIAQRLVSNLSRPFHAAIVWMNHFQLCHQLNVKEALPFLKDAIRSNGQYSDYERGQLLTFYIELGGQLSQLTFVFNEFDSQNDFYWSLLDKLVEIPGYKKRISDFLLKKLADNQLATDDFRLIKLLINAGAIKGLSLYADWVKANGKIPQTYDRLEGVKNLPAQEASNIFLDLIGYAFEHALVGDRFQEPLDLFVHELKELVLGNETLYQHVHANLNSILSAHSEHPELFRLKRNIAQLEQEYYLQKTDYANVAEALGDLRDYDI